MPRLIRRVSVSFTKGEYENLVKAAEGRNLSHYIRILVTDADGETSFQRWIATTIGEIMAGVDLLVETDGHIRKAMARLKDDAGGGPPVR